MSGILCFTNCYLLQENGDLLKKDLWIDQETGTILDAQLAFFDRKERPQEILDLEGGIISPGLIDIQINGAYGFDFSAQHYTDEEYEKGLEMVARRIVETGVTSLVPTIVTQDKALYPAALKRVHPVSSPSSASLLGWHAEGPYLETSKRGAHSLAFLATAPNGFGSFEEVYGSSSLASHAEWRNGGRDPSAAGVRIITLAPDVEGVLEGIEELTSRGIIVSMGHSAATSSVAIDAIKRGTTLITHLFNAMPQLHHRDPSIIGVLGASKRESPKFQRPYYTIIADGVHLHPHSVQMAYSTHPEGCILMTDALHILDPNLQDGVHEWHHGKRLLKDGDKLYVDGTTVLAGSCVTLDKCVRNLVDYAEISLGAALKCATFNPAKCLGIEDRKGTLRSGADADLVIFDRQGVPQSTWIKGRHAWSLQRQEELRPCGP